MTRHVDFETSPDLRRLFSQELALWRKRTRLGIEDLSAKCGVSSSYLSHVGRYGRIPSKPVLLLLGLNFGMEDPGALFRAANLSEEWPFDNASEIRTREAPSQGFFTVKLDMEGFVDAIKSVVRAEVRPRSLPDLLKGRPLRIGLNPTQPWLYAAHSNGLPDFSRGLIPDFCELLGQSLHCAIETLPIPFDQYRGALRDGDIDIFGPMLATPHCASHILFSKPINRLGLSIVARSRENVGLARLPLPTRFEDLRNGQYEIAVLRNSRAHLIANTRLHRSNDTLIVCDSDQEALMCVLAQSIPKPAHVFLCNSMDAKRQSLEYPTQLKLLFAEPGTVIEMCDNSFAVRPDWTDALPIINHALTFILSSGGFAYRFRELRDSNGQGVFDIVSGALS